MNVFVHGYNKFCIPQYANTSKIWIYIDVFVVTINLNVDSPCMFFWCLDFYSFLVAFNQGFDIPDCESTSKFFSNRYMKRYRKCGLSLILLFVYYVTKKHKVKSKREPGCLWIEISYTINFATCLPFVIQRPKFHLIHQHLAYPFTNLNTEHEGNGYCQNHKRTLRWLMNRFHTTVPWVM